MITLKMAAASQVPHELLLKPLGFVAFTGLDVVNNAMHCAIWDAFNSSKRQEKTLNIKPVTGDYECPRKRQKRTSYEFYVPKGILKANWMKKHLTIIPSLLVIFFDLDWDDSQWKDKEMECASKVAVFRASLQGRNTKLAVVLIQKNTPLPPGEDVLARERATSLCNACELAAVSLLVLPFSDHLRGYVTRIENAFKEISQSYYINEIKRVKAHREYLNKSQHQLLYVRHQFKIAMFCELKHDVTTALKHYKQAYLHALEIKLTDVNNLEVKTVAGFINYKICRLNFRVNAPLDAISQFRKHIDYFKARTGIPDLAFEHSAWMAKQFSLFGDIFHDAVKDGLQAIQTQHPGFYHQQAALHSMTRREDCIRLCKFSQKISPDPLEKADSLEYLGQRPWRQCCQANEPLDSAMEQAGIMSLQAQELNFDHSGIIFQSLSNAVTQFREYKSVRLTLSLMVKMGEECFHAKDHAKALSLLNRVTVYYRSERWWALLTSILVTGLRCAYFTGSVEDYVTFSLELVGRHAEIEVDEKKRIMGNLLKVVEGEVPDPEIIDGASTSEGDRSCFENAMASKKLLSIPMTTLAGFVECRAAFDADSFHADEEVSIKVYLRSTAVMPVKISNLSIIFSNQAYNQLSFSTLNDESADDKHSTSLVLNPETVKCVSFSFVPLPADIGSRLEVNHIRFNIGRQAVLVWNGAGIDANCQSSEFQQSGYGRISVMRNRTGDINWSSVQIHPFTDLVPRKCNIALNFMHDAPSYVGEYHQIKIEVVNTEEHEITDICIKVRVEVKDEEQSRRTSCILKSIPNDKGDESEKDEELLFEVGSLTPSAQAASCFYLHSQHDVEEKIIAEVEYVVVVPCGDSQSNVTCKCMKEETLTVKVLSPIAVSYRFSNMQFRMLDKINAMEPFLLFCRLGISPEWPILIKSTSFQLNDRVSLESGGSTGQLTDTELSDGSEAAECHCLVTSEISMQSEEISLGHYFIEWRRIDSSLTMPSVVTKVPLPNIIVEETPIYIETNLPSCGSTQEVVPVSYTIYNRTNMVQEVEGEIEPSDDFMFSGNSQVQFRILPHDSHVLYYNMYPTVPGNAKIPKLHVSLPRYLSKSVDTMAQRMLPNSIFVTPMKLVDQTSE